MKLPHFLIIGAAKCGTTSLYLQLRQHPQVYLPDIKEPTFFSERGIGTWSKGLEWYSSLFTDAADDQIRGEASTSYSKAPWYGDAAEKIHQTIPEAKLIYMVRNPVSQIVSHYEHMLFAELVKGRLTRNLIKKNYLIRVANYREQLDCYTKLFPSTQIHVVVVESYIQKNIEAFKKICDFLEIKTIKKSLLQHNARRERKILRHTLLKHVNKASAMTAYERQKALPNWMLKPQAKVTISRKNINYIKETLADDLHAFANTWKLDISEWNLSSFYQDPY
ncbi:MAG: sulfotransferase [Gammaproteobacteria bacterium]|jgi:hypothetical protein|nr:sulfotransferase [Gammaproteobacteria bacterium]